MTSKPTTIAGYGITDAFDGTYGSLTGTPTIPTNNNQLTNGAGYLTNAIDSAGVSAIITADVDQAFVNALGISGGGGVDSAGISSIITADVDQAFVENLGFSTGGLSGTNIDTTSFTATAGQTTFNITYTVGKLNVYLNGILLDASDYTASNGTTVVLGTGANVNDILHVITYEDAPMTGAINQTYVYTASANQTAFTGSDNNSSTLSYIVDSIMVYLNGILLIPTTDYTASNGHTVTLVTGASVNDELQIITIGGEGGTLGTWSERSGSYTAIAGNKLFVDVSSVAATITLPASASLGDEVRIIDATGNCSTNNITINRNGHNINGDAEDLVIDVDRAAIGLAYYNSTQGWVFIER